MGDFPNNRKSLNPCADAEGFAIGGPTLTTFFVVVFCVCFFSL